MASPTILIERQPGHIKARMVFARAVQAQVPNGRESCRQAGIDLDWPHQVVLPARFCERGGYNEDSLILQRADALHPWPCRVS